MRKIIQIQVARLEGEPTLYVALCDDGTTWCLDAWDDWLLLPAIPQDEEESDQ